MNTNKEINLINKWLDYIPNKKILRIKLNDELTNIYNKQTKLNCIIIFDVEFIRLCRNNEQLQTINEMGGIILYKVKYNWYLFAIYHFNLPPQHSHMNELYLMLSKYNTLSKKTENKNIILENKLFKYYPKDKNIYFKINGYSLLKKKKQYNLFIQIINNIFRDTDYKERLIEDDKKFMKLTNKIFNNSYLIVKGTEDFKALNNHLILLKIKPLLFNNYFDIAIYNNVLFNQCNSAELSKTYECLDKLNLTYNFELYLKIINEFTNLKPHNPLVDAYLTWIVYNIFILKRF